MTRPQPTVRTEEVEPGIVLVTFDVPEKLNAISLRFVRELTAVLDDVSADRAVRAVVLTGAGRGFSAGRDLDDEAGGADAALEEWYDEQETLAALVLRIRSVPQPVIAAVNGPAAGGGLAMALAADTRLCSPDARFNAAFVRLGLSGCDVGVSYLLPRIVGPTLAFEMMLTGRMVEADEAHRCGLVLDVVPADELLEAAMAIARRIRANSPFGIRMTKQVMWQNLDAVSLPAAMQLENRTQILCVGTEDFREAVAAFVARRPAAAEPEPAVRQR